MNHTSENRPGRHICVALVAHVDAGKTTLSEAMLYETGQIRTPGRVDHQDSFLDTDLQERERGITIFSKQAQLEEDGWRMTLLDTPGHVDFSAEMERTLRVLDCAVLVISGTDGVQGHTRTLWRLLRHYKVPVFLFVNKMDLAGADRETLIGELKTELSDSCMDFTYIHDSADKDGQAEELFWEEAALCGEDLLNEYMNTGRICDDSLQKAIASREIFPCYFGSALRQDGVRELLDGLKQYVVSPEYPDDFSARVYKVGRDAQGVRLTYLRVTGGRLEVKDIVEYDGCSEKIDQIRIYSGDKYRTVNCVTSGEICAVTGLTRTVPGLGIGDREQMNEPVLEPVLTYQILLPKETNPAEMMGKLRQLEEEDPQLHIVWDEKLQEIHAQMMGQVQIEVLTRLIRDRFGVEAAFGPGNIVYRETIAAPVEGIGHFEPLRHYAEVHILLEPGEPGSGIQISSVCSEDVLDLNWQRLIATHIGEREHAGVLTGSALTDVKCTILTGRAHLKHTEGGDFRQATYRAIRQGLKSTESVLLEPYYGFLLEIPMAYVGRAMTDLRQRAAKFGQPEYFATNSEEMARISGTAPVASMQDYMSEVHSYTQGQGALTLELCGYDVCHNSEEVIAQKAYDSESDLENPTGSVFCAHGAGFIVPWNEVDQYMHLPRVYDPSGGESQKDGFSYETQGAAFRNAAESGRKSWEKSIAAMSEIEIDKELSDVYAREFGMSRADVEEQERRKWSRKPAVGERERAFHVKIDKKGNPIYPSKKQRPEFLIVDGYNIIFAWQELKELSKTNIDSARDKLKDMLLGYQGFVKCKLLVVFDAYKVKGNTGKQEFFDGRNRKNKMLAEPLREGEIPLGIDVVYTKQDETADAYIERTVHEYRDKYQIIVATSDGLEQLTVLSMGALRMSAANLREEINRAQGEWKDYLV